MRADSMAVFALVAVLIAVGTTLMFSVVRRLVRRR
jgi:hypothetical protein